MSSACLARQPCRHVLRQSRRSTVEPFGRPQRCFSTTPIARDSDDQAGQAPSQRRLPTTYRRRMYRWLATTGRGFSAHKPGTMNYMNAKGQAPRPKSGDGDGELGAEQDDDLDRDEDEDEDEDVDEDDEDEDEYDEDDEDEDDEFDDDDPDNDEGEGEGDEDDPDRKSAKGKEKGKRKRPKQLAKPFPLNPRFMSQPVLSDKRKDQIFDAVVNQKMSVSAASVKFGVDMRRVAAVVRLGTVERNWLEEGKPLISTYAATIMSMLPQTKTRAHEPINDLPIHPSTLQQIFYPASESRDFSRKDAAKVFSSDLLTADERIPHPEMIEAARDEHEGKNEDQLDRIMQQYRARAEGARQDRDSKARLALEQRTTVVPAARCDFRFESIVAEKAGKDGRGVGGVGWRYGMPFEDRKRGHAKQIPLSVPA